MVGRNIFLHAGVHFGLGKMRTVDTTIQYYPESKSIVHKSRFKLFWDCFQHKNSCIWKFLTKPCLLVSLHFDGQTKICKLHCCTLHLTGQEQVLGLQNRHKISLTCWWHVFIHALFCESLETSSLQLNEAVLLFSYLPLNNNVWRLVNLNKYI